MVSQEPKKSKDVRFVALCCIVFELSACKYSAEFSLESGYKANDLTRYNVVTAFYLIVIFNILHLIEVY